MDSITDATERDVDTISFGGPNLNYRHQFFTDEPLLWLADGIAYNHGANQRWRCRPGTKPGESKRYACAVLPIPHHEDGHRVWLFDEREPDCLLVLHGFTIAFFADRDRDGDCRSVSRRLEMGS